MQKVLITGGTGLIGSKIIKNLLERGVEVNCLSRSSQKGHQISYFKWDVRNQTIDKKAFEGVDGIIHLAGAGIADQRWSDNRKKVILESRTHSTQLLRNTLSEIDHQVTSFVGASAIGWYGDSGDRLVDENEPRGKGFMADVVEAWENENLKLTQLNIRLALIRIGVVMSTEGGALPEMMKPIKLFAGASLGSGKQYMSWIHEDDLARLFVKAILHPEWQGIYNGVAPHPATNHDITHAIGKTIGRPILLPNVPEFALRLMLGEMADMVLFSNKVSSEKTEKMNFRWQFPELKGALDDLLK